MKKIKAIIGRTSDGFYSIHCVDEMFSGGGNTPQEAKNDIMEQMYFLKETAQREGLDYPQFLNGEFEIDIQS